MLAPSRHNVECSGRIWLRVSIGGTVVEIQSSRRAKVLYLADSDEVRRFYRAFADPAQTDYVVKPESEAAHLARQVTALQPQQQQVFVKNFEGAAQKLRPESHGMLLGAAAGGTLGLGFAATSLSLKAVTDAVSHPAGFVLGLAALGATIGGLSAKVVNYMAEETDRQLKVSSELSVETPQAWNLVLPKVAVTLTAEPGSEDKS